MIRLMRFSHAIPARWLYLLGLCIIILSTAGFAPLQQQAITAKTKTPKSSSAGYSPYDVIAGVNSVRAAYGLPALQVNAALMAAAQAHSEYQASIGSITHSGAGGSNPKGRAIAAGYGGGSNVGVTENIYGGMNATPQMAVSWWKGDSLHLNTMIGERYVDVGAGVAVGNGVVYYTLDVGYVAGGAIPAEGSSTGAVAPNNTGAPAASTAVAYSPVQLASPGPDGAVIHTVQAGQTLWTIAAVYQITLADLLKLNGLGENAYIFPGDKLIIKSPEARPDHTPSATSPPADFVPTATSAITSSPEAVSLALTATPESGGAAPTPIAAARQSTIPDLDANLLLWIIGSLVIGGTLLMLIGSLINRRV